MLSLITVSLLKQGFCFYKFSLHIEMMVVVVGVSGQERNKEKSGKQT